MKGRGLFQSAEFRAAIQEITAGNLRGDKNTPQLRDQVISQAGHVSNLIGDARTSTAVERVVATGKSLGDAMDALNKDANLAPQFKVIAEAVAHIAGDVPLKSVKDLGGLDGRYFPESREIHIVSDAGANDTLA